MMQIPELWDQYRVDLHGWQQDRCNGALQVPAIVKGGATLRIIVSNGGGWEHVSVSTEGRCPVWAEMEFVKRQMWEADDVVMQLHVAESSHVNHHPYCLHMWRPLYEAIPFPPAWMVGPTS